MRVPHWIHNDFCEFPESTSGISNKGTAKHLMYVNQLWFLFVMTCETDAIDRIEHQCHSHCNHLFAAAKRTNVGVHN